MEYTKTMEKNEKKLARLDYIDCVRGIAIFLVVFAHIAERYMKFDSYPEYYSLYELVYKITYAFHMPLLMMISGYVYCYVFFSEKRVREVKLKNHVLDLGILYFLMSFLAFFSKIIFSNDVLEPISFDSILYIFIKPIGHLWYLHVLIVLYFINIYLVKLTNVYKSTVFIVAFVLLCMFSDFVPRDTMIASLLARIMKYELYFYIGIVMKEEPEHFLLRKSLIYLYFIASVITLYFAMAQTERPDNQRFIHVIMAVGLSLGIIYFCKWYSIGNVGVFRKLGLISLEIYLLHQYLITLLRLLLSRICSNGIISLFLNVTITLVLIAALVKTIKHYGIRDYIFKPYSSICNVLRRKQRICR
ncbi:Fucose 4-O-acetylase [Butyrivibrio sp. INlla14]|nr:Fucose 4-O-acetylase [Butyrivibrio sp. INlla14]